MNAIPLGQTCDPITYEKLSCQTNCKNITCENAGYLTNMPEGDLKCYTKSYLNNKVCYYGCRAYTCSDGGYNAAYNSTDYQCTAITYHNLLCYGDCKQKYAVDVRIFGNGDASLSSAIPMTRKEKASSSDTIGYSARVVSGTTVSFTTKAISGTFMGLYGGATWRNPDGSMITAPDGTTLTSGDRMNFYSAAEAYNSPVNYDTNRLLIDAVYVKDLTPIKYYLTIKYNEQYMTISLSRSSTNKEPFGVKVKVNVSYKESSYQDYQSKDVIMFAEVANATSIGSSDPTANNVANSLSKYPVIINKVTIMETKPRGVVVPMPLTTTLQTYNNNYYQLPSPVYGQNTTFEVADHLK